MSTLSAKAKKRFNYVPALEILEDRWAPAVLSPGPAANQDQAPVMGPVQSSPAPAATPTNAGTGATTTAPGGRTQAASGGPSFPFPADGGTNGANNANDPNNNQSFFGNRPVLPQITLPNQPVPISPSDALSARVAQLAAVGATLPLRVEQTFSFYPGGEEQADSQGVNALFAKVSTILDFGSFDFVFPGPVLRHLTNEGSANVAEPAI